MPMVEVYTSANIDPPVRRKLIWRGDLDAPPRVGEWIEVLDGWSIERVLEVQHILCANVVRIIVSPDYLDDYPSFTAKDGDAPMRGEE